MGIWVAAALLLSVVFARGYTREQFYNADAYDYAQMGRQLAEGQGFTGLQAFPRHLVFFHERGMGPDEPWPDLYRYPLSVAGAGLFQLFIDDPVSAAIVRSGFFFVCGLALFGWLAERLSGSRWIGLGIVSVLASDRELWIDAYSGMVDSQAAFLLALHAIALLFVPRTSKGAFVVGLGAALLYLAKTQFAGALPISLLLLAWDAPREVRLKIGASFIAGCLLALAPWMAHNLVHAGEPNFSFTTTRSFGFGTTPVGSDFEMAIDAPLTMGALLSEHGGALLAKFRFGLLQHLKQPIYQSAMYSILAYAMLFGLTPRHRFPGAGNALLFLRFCLGMLLVHVLAESLSYPTPRFSYPYRAPMLIGAALLLRGLLRSLPSLASAHQKLAVAALFGLAALPGAVSLSQKGLGVPAGQAPRVPVEEIQELCAAEALIASDVSYALALDARRRSVRWPTFPQDLLRLDETVRPIDFVYASAQIPESSRRTEPQATVFPNYVHYANFLKSTEFLERYALVQRFPDGGRLYANRAIR